MAQRCTRPAALPSAEADRRTAAAALSEADIQLEPTRGHPAIEAINQAITDGRKENADRLLASKRQYADFRALTIIHA